MAHIIKHISKNKMVFGSLFAVSTQWSLLGSSSQLPLNILKENILVWFVELVCSAELVWSPELVWSAELMLSSELVWSSELLYFEELVYSAEHCKTMLSKKVIFLQPDTELHALHHLRPRKSLYLCIFLN